MKKRLAILLYGHVRTYARTRESFFQKVIEANKKDGWEIDIFMHTWDCFSHKDPSVWHKTICKRDFFPTMEGKKLSDSDKQDIIDTYKPKKYAIDVDTHQSGGRDRSFAKVAQLCKDYEKESGVEYDYYLITRPDMAFIRELRIDSYLEEYEREGVDWFKWYNLSIPKKVNFCLHNPFRVRVIDPRLPKEADLLWFSNYIDGKFPYGQEYANINIFLEYRLLIDVIVCREITKEIKPDFYWIMLEYAIDKHDLASLLAQDVVNSLSYKLGYAITQSPLKYRGFRRLIEYIKMPWTIMKVRRKHKNRR